MNINYGKLNDGVIEYAPDYIDTKYGRINFPTESNYKFYGWKKIIRDSDTILGWFESGSTIRSININRDYGMLVDGNIKYAPDVLKIGYNYVEPTEAQYIEEGYKRIIDSDNGVGISEILDREFIYIIRSSTNYAKLVDGKLVFAVNMIVSDNSVNIDPTDKDYLSIGFKKVIYRGYPESIEGYDWIEDGYDETETEITNKYKAVEVPVPPPEPRVFSKRNLELAIFNSGVPGLLSKVDTFIDSQEVTNEFGDKIPLRRLYDTALTLSESNDQFKNFLTAIKTAIPELTDELIENILSNSIAK